MIGVQVATVAWVNGYEVCSKRAGLLGRRTFFVRWMHGEWDTQAEAEAEAARGQLIDFGDDPEPRP